MTKIEGFRCINVYGVYENGRRLSFAGSLESMMSRHKIEGSNRDLFIKLLISNEEVDLPSDEIGKANPHWPHRPIKYVASIQCD
jgi:hypothetical protein